MFGFVPIASCPVLGALKRSWFHHLCTLPSGVCTHWHWCCSGRDRQCCMVLLAAAGHQPVPELELEEEQGRAPSHPSGQGAPLATGNFPLWWHCAQHGQNCLLVKEQPPDNCTSLNSLSRAVCPSQTSLRGLFSLGMPTLPCFISHFWFLPFLVAPLCSCPLSASLPCNLEQSQAAPGRGGCAAHLAWV